jgi:hypothetical protein
MTDEARRGYTLLARLFLIVGGVFALLAVLQIAGGLRLFNGDPLGVALIVLVIGVLLEWTVRTAPPPSVAPEESAEGTPDQQRAEMPGIDERLRDEPSTEREGRDPTRSDRD